MTCGLLKLAKQRVHWTNLRPTLPKDKWEPLVYTSNWSEISLIFIWIYSNSHKSDIGSIQAIGVQLPSVHSPWEAFLQTQPVIVGEDNVYSISEHSFWFFSVCRSCFIWRADQICPQNQQQQCSRGAIVMDARWGLFFVFLLYLWCILAKLNNKIIKIQSKTIKIILNQFVNKSVLKSPDCCSAWSSICV